jgi:adenylate kinase
MKLMLLGPPGAGKGTLAKQLSEGYSIPAVSSGELFRNEAASGSDLGVRLKAIMEKGDLVPDDITVQIVKKRIEAKDARPGFLLDGFPRTRDQAEALAEFVTLDRVLNLVVSDQEVIRRLSGRRLCPVCGTIYHVEFMPPKTDELCDRGHGALITRDDDKIDAIKNRLIVYKRQTEPLIRYYNDKGLLCDIDASLAPDEVVSQAREALAS